jgi:TPR repeat protein
MAAFAKIVGGRTSAVFSGPCTNSPRRWLRQAERETVLHEAEDAQRKRAMMARIRNAALVAVSILSVIAGWLYWSAAQQRKIAEEQRAIAEEQRGQADRILARATNIIANLYNQMNLDTRKQAFAVFRMGADRGDATSMANLANVYADGLVVTQDYAKARRVVREGR